MTGRPAATLIDLLERNRLDAGLFHSVDPDYPFRTEVVGTEDTALVRPPGTVLEGAGAPAPAGRARRTATGRGGHRPVPAGRTHGDEPASADRVLCGGRPPGRTDSAHDRPPIMPG